MTDQLQIPEIADKPDPGVELRLVYLEEWIEGLPYASLSVLLQSLSESLERLNRCPVKPALRFALLECYLTAYDYLLELQETHAPVHTIAAFEKHRSDAAAVRKVASEMATGYKIVVTHLSGKRGLLGPGKELRAALQRSALFLSLQLLHSYDQYLPTPKGVWRELGSVHRLAAAAGLHEQPAPGHGSRPEFAESVLTTYKRALLTSLVDPYHLAHREVWKVYAGFGAELADAATLLEPGPVERPAGLFVVDPDEDHRPIGYADARDEMTARCLLLDANPVRKRLETSPPTSLTQTLRSAMIRALGLPPKRHTPRARSEGQVSLAAGLRAVHHFLGGESLDAEVAAPPPPDGDQLIDVGAEDSAPAIRFETTYVAEFWDLVDRGPGGVGVLKRIRPSHPIGVGEVIGVQFRNEDDSPGPWTVGVIRWLSVGPNGEYQAGVQILSRVAEAVLIDFDNGSGPAAALAVPGLAADKGAALITHSGVFAGHRELTIRAAGGGVQIRPESLIEATGAFERFSFRALD